MFQDDTALFYAGKSVVDIGEKLTADMGNVAVFYGGEQADSECF